MCKIGKKKVEWPSPHIILYFTAAADDVALLCVEQQLHRYALQGQQHVYVIKNDRTALDITCCRRKKTFLPSFFGSPHAQSFDHEMGFPKIFVSLKNYVTGLFFRFCIWSQTFNACCQYKISGNFRGGHFLNTHQHLWKVHNVVVLCLCLFLVQLLSYKESCTWKQT